ncbi:hypothetical protein [Litorihabitans aurantiacus]|uniref:Uncharacterized protein n=1 Tax=Litorihabitans aurantiacus TaxID=1930061 RepID=A0AA38CVQ7_9MICO|nr:hypothetical protein [Litorihabitans aurantiacus]GMA33055.1 hypothetical protein GCM10025875_30470 [Litorihabitans aurantiacus]
MRVRLEGPSDYAAFALLLLVSAAVAILVVGTVLTWLGRLLAALGGLLS